MRTFVPALYATHPDDWFVKESLTLVAPSGQANVIFGSEPLAFQVDVETYVASQGDEMSRGLPHYVEHALEPVVVFHQFPGYLRHFEWTPPNGVRVSQLQVYYVDGGRCYTATATTPTATFGDYEQALREMLAGLGVRA